MFRLEIALLVRVVCFLRVVYTVNCVKSSSNVLRLSSRNPPASGTTFPYFGVRAVVPFLSIIMFTYCNLTRYDTVELHLTEAVVIGMKLRCTSRVRFVYVCLGQESFEEMSTPSTPC